MSWRETVGLNLSPLGNIADAAGNVLPKVEPATDETYLIDNTPPEPPASLDLTAASDTGISDTDDITADNTPTDCWLCGTFRFCRVICRRCKRWDSDR